MFFRQLESNDLSFLPAGSLDAISMIQQIRLSRNPWHCDCRASYIASWLRRRFASFANLTNPLQIQQALILTGNWSIWEFGAGATCRGPGILGGQSLLRLTFHELCEGQWASMKGIIPRLPLDVIASSIMLPRAIRKKKHNFGMIWLNNIFWNNYLYFTVV